MLQKYFIRTIALLLLTHLLSITVSGQTVAVSLTDFTNAKLNTTYIDAEGNEVTVKSNENVSATSFFSYFKDLDNPLFCAGGSLAGGEKYNRIVLKGTDNVNNTNQCPYILISLAGTQSLNQLRILGYGIGADLLTSAELTCAFSKSGTADANFNLKDGTQNLAKALQFKIDECNNHLIDIPEGTKHIMLIARRAFGFVSISLTRAVELHAIQLLTPEPTGIEQNREDGFVCNAYNQSLSFSEEASVQVYSLSGAMVLNIKHAKDIDLSALNKGAYIVKAKSLQSGASLVKKILR